MVERAFRQHGALVQAGHLDAEVADEIHVVFDDDDGVIPRDLAEHQCLQYGYQAEGNRWRLHGEGGQHVVAVRGRLCVNNGEVLRQAAVAGLGVVLVPVFIVAPSLRDGSLVRVLPGWSPADTAIHVVYPHARGLSAKVRAFVDFMARRFGGTPTWDRDQPDVG